MLSKKLEKSLFSVACVQEHSKVLSISVIFLSEKYLSENQILPALIQIALFVEIAV